MKGVAYLDIDARLFRDLLGLPDTAEIVASAEGEDGIVRVLVSHGTIPRGAIRVTAKFRKAEGLTEFDSFEVIDCAEKAA